MIEINNDITFGEFFKMDVNIGDVVLFKCKYCRVGNDFCLHEMSFIEVLRFKILSTFKDIN